MINEIEAERIKNAVREGMGIVAGMLDGYEKRLGGVEQDIAKIIADLYGDPDKRSGNPSVYEKLEALNAGLLTRIDDSAAATVAKIDALGQIVARHDISIRRRDAIEATAFRMAGAVFKFAGVGVAGRLGGLLLTTIGGSLLGLLIGALTGITR